jgi:hypothetical protein
MPERRQPCRLPAALSAPEQRLLALLTAREQLARQEARQPELRLPVPPPDPLPGVAAGQPPRRSDAGGERVHQA